MRDDKIHQLYSQMQLGQGKSGMQTLNQSLANLIMKRMVDPDIARGRSPDVDELNQLINKGPDAKSAAGGRRS
jgi:twitching motility protein PilT